MRMIISKKSIRETNGAGGIKSSLESVYGFAE